MLLRKGDLVGYARVSTNEQNLSLQVNALKEIGCIKIFEETKSGKSIDRPILNQCINELRIGDTLVFWNIDRISRSLKDTLVLLNQLDERKIYYRSITQVFDNSTPEGRLQNNISMMFSQFEREKISQRTTAGLKATRERGTILGRPPVFNKKQEDQIIEIFRTKMMSVIDIANLYRVSRYTIYKTIKNNGVTI